VQKETRVGIFYKPAGATGEAVYSSAPVTTADIPATVLKAMGADYSLYGAALDEIAQGQDRVRPYYKTIYVGDPLKEAYLYTYEIRGDASVFDNWVLVDEGEIPYGYN
jgi:arylsulfatase A-like enzyme